MGSTATNLRREPKPVKVRIRWYDPVTFQTSAEAPNAVFFEFAKGPDVKLTTKGEPKKEAKTHIFDYELEVPGERMLVGVSAGDVTTAFQVTPGRDARVVDLPTSSVEPKRQRAMIKVHAEEYIPTYEGPQGTMTIPTRKPLEDGIFSAELLEVAGAHEPKKPERAKESPISSVVTQGKADLQVGASGLYKVTITNPEFYESSNPILPLWLFVSTGETIDLKIVFERRHNLDLAPMEVTFTDESGKPLDNRKVYIRSKETGQEQMRSTNNEGRVLFTVPKGKYEVSAEAPDSDFTVLTKEITV